MKQLMLLISMSLISAAAYSGPFGLEMGTSFDELSKKLELKPHGSEKQQYVYNASVVPNPHPDFNRYILSISPEQGLCSIVAVSNPVKADYNEVRSKILAIEEELSVKYGSPKRRDSFARSSRRYAMQDWPFGMPDNAQIIKSRWFDRNLDRFNLTSIQLNAELSSGDKSFMELIYHFKNSDKCKAPKVPQESVL